MAKKLKIKSHRGAAKRFKKTGTGKFTRAAAFKRHLLTSKSTQMKRHARGNKMVSDSEQNKLRRMLPYD
ncbi:MAG: 50S ribosomal protein L35 [Acidobacteriota bacterium]